MTRATAGAGLSAWSPGMGHEQACGHPSRSHWARTARLRRELAQHERGGRHGASSPLPARLSEGPLAVARPHHLTKGLGEIVCIAHRDHGPTAVMALSRHAIERGHGRHSPHAVTLVTLVAFAYSMRRCTSTKRQPYRHASRASAWPPLLGTNEDTAAVCKRLLARLRQRIFISTKRRSPRTKKPPDCSGGSQTRREKTD